MIGLGHIIAMDWKIGLNTKTKKKEERKEGKWGGGEEGVRDREREERWWEKIKFKKKKHKTTNRAEKG